MTKNKYLKDKYKVLRDFNIAITDDIKNIIENMYPNKIRIDRYTRALILEKLNSSKLN